MNAINTGVSWQRGDKYKIEGASGYKGRKTWSINSPFPNMRPSAYNDFTPRLSSLYVSNSKLEIIAFQ
jgi:hypothetical protein